MNIAIIWPNLDHVVQTSSAEVAGRGYAVPRVFFRLLHFVWRAIRETLLFFFRTGFGLLRQASAAEVAGRGCNVSALWQSTSTLRRRAWATRNTSFRISRLQLGRSISVKGEKLTA